MTNNYTFEERMEIHQLIEYGTPEEITIAAKSGVDFSKEENYALLYASVKGEAEAFKSIQGITNADVSKIDGVLKYSIASGNSELANYLFDKFQFSSKAYEAAYKTAVTENAYEFMDKISRHIENNQIFEEAFEMKSRSEREHFKEGFTSKNKSLDLIESVYFNHLVELTNIGKFKPSITLVGECLKNATQHQTKEFVSSIIETFALNKYSDESKFSDKKKVALTEAYKTSLENNGVSGKRGSITDEILVFMSKDPQLKEIAVEMSVTHQLNKNPNKTKDQIMDRIQDEIIMREELDKLLRSSLKTKNIEMLGEAEKDIKKSSNFTPIKRM